MASVVLGLGAAYIGAGQSLIVQGALAIGAAVAGSYLDNEIFGDDVRSNDEFDPFIPNQQISNEGGPALFCLGTEAVVSGQLIWMTDPVDLGPPRGLVSNVAIAVARNPINGILRVFSRNHDIYEFAGTELVVSTTITITPTAYSPSGNYEEVKLSEPAAGLDLTQRKYARSNVTTLAGWANERNRWGNDTQWPYQSVNPGGAGAAMSAQPVGGGSELVLRRYNLTGARLAIAETASVAKPVSITQVFDKVNGSLSDGVAIYRGIAGQAVDPIIAGAHGADAQAFEGIAYMVVNNLRLAQFGSRIPEDIQVTVDQNGIPLSLPQAVLQVMAYGAGRYAGSLPLAIGSGVYADKVTFDISALDGIRFVRGYAARGNLSTAKLLEPLMVAHDFTAQQDERGRIRFFHPDDARVWDVPEGDFLEPPRMQDLQGQNLPTSVTVHFTDAEAFRYEVGSVEEHISYQDIGTSRRSASNVTTIDLRMMTMTEDEARVVAKRALWRPRMRRTRVSASLSARHAHIKEGDGFSSFLHGKTRVVTVTKIERGANWELQIEGFVREELPLEVL